MQLAVALYAVMSVVSFVLFGVDKRSARRGGRRVPESTLHMVELLGGFPGAILAQGAFRHKTRKWSYQVVLWIIVVAHGAGWALWLSRP